MSAALMKELLLDYGMDKLSTEETADIDRAFKLVELGGAIHPHELAALKAYIYGYTAQEIAAGFTRMTGTHVATNAVEHSLARTVQAIATVLYIEDEELVHKVNRNPKYAASRASLLKEFLEDHSQRFMQHSVPTAYKKGE